MAGIRDPRRAQAGTTLVELLVALSIAAFALAIIVGTLSSGLLQSTIAKRNTAVQAVLQYEVERIGASGFDGSAAPYSDCFATEDPTDPTAASGYQLDCPSGPYALRADVTWQWLPSSSTVQVWTITVHTLPSGDAVGSPVQTYKVTHS
jgi:type II secretory pathway pseudopilin PulG